jgi:hypothetical protein
MNEFHKIIKKLSHSRERVPYTYHHDYLRENVNKFKNSSRAEVAKNHTENENEMYAVALVEILNKLDFIDTLNLTRDDINICEKAVYLTKDIINRYNNN